VNIERIAMRLRFQGSGLSKEEQEEVWFVKLKEGTKDYWRNFVREVISAIEEESK
jgi:hypothetical protein